MPLDWVEQVLLHFVLVVIWMSFWLLFVMLGDIKAPFSFRVF